MNSKCKTFKLLISCYVDGEISDKQKEFIEQHMKKCVSCNSFFNSLMKIEGVFNEFQLKKTSDDFEKRLFSKIKSEEIPNIYMFEFIEAIKRVLIISLVPLLVLIFLTVQIRTLETTYDIMQDSIVTDTDNANSESLKLINNMIDSSQDFLSDYINLEISK